MQTHISNWAKIYDHNVDVTCEKYKITDEFSINLLHKAKYDILWNQLALHTVSTTPRISCNQLFEIGKETYSAKELFYSRNFYLYQDIHFNSNPLKINNLFLNYLNENRIISPTPNMQKSSYQKISLAIPPHLTTFFHTLICVWTERICTTNPAIGRFCEESLFSKYFEEFISRIQNIDDIFAKKEHRLTKTSIWQSIEFNSTLFDFAFQCCIKDTIKKIRNDFSQLQYKIITPALTQQDKITELQYRLNKNNYNLLNHFQSCIIDSLTKFSNYPYLSVQNELVKYIGNQVHNNFFTEEDLQKTINIYYTYPSIPADLQDQLDIFDNAIHACQEENQKCLDTIQEEDFFEQTKINIDVLCPKKDLSYYEKKLNQRLEKCKDELLQAIQDFLHALAQPPLNKYTILDLEVYCAYIDDCYSKLLSKRDEATRKFRTQFGNVKKAPSEITPSILEKSKNCLLPLYSLNIELNTLSDYTDHFFKNTKIKHSLLSDTTRIESCCDKKYHQLLRLIDETIQKSEYLSFLIQDLKNRTTQEEWSMFENSFPEIFEYLKEHNYFQQ